MAVVFGDLGNRKKGTTNKVAFSVKLFFFRLLGTTSAIIFVFFCVRVFSSLESINSYLQPPTSNNETSKFCLTNPYIPFLNTSHDIIQAYGKQLPFMRERAVSDPQTKHDHERFRPFQELASCEQACIGGACRSDTSKIMCGLESLQGEKDCVVYSVGGNNQWQFEMDILKRTKCEVHTFDCTGDRQRFEVPPHERLHFHYECLLGGNSTTNRPSALFLSLNEMTQKYGHKQIDLFKIDIEGFEWGVFESFSHMQDKSPLPMQILVEVHYRTQFKELYDTHRRDWKSETDMVELAASLYDMGYIVANRDDNRRCRHCTELTLVRAYCQQQEGFRQIIEWKDNLQTSLSTK